MSQEPFAYIAHKDGHWWGVIAASAGKRSIKEFFAEFAGYSIHTAHSRKEYLEFTEANPMRDSTAPLLANEQVEVKENVR